MLTAPGKADRGWRLVLHMDLVKMRPACTANKWLGGLRNWCSSVEAGDEARIE